MRKSKGFTLIELLVVIAIIGILAAIVLVSLGGARNKANDARIKADLTQIRTVAELWYDNNSYSYATLCSGTNDVDTLMADMNTQSGGTSLCFADADSYCASSPLKSSATTYVCVSSAGQVGNDICVDENTACTP